MWSYLARRILLMIPTLFGVTIVSFCIMQLAPGDPLQSRLGAGGSAGQSTQNREQYLIQRRELKLDKPLLLNFNNFKNYSSQVRHVSRWRGMTDAELAEELKAIATDPATPEHAASLAALRKLGIKRLQRQLFIEDLTAEQLADSNLTPESWAAQRRARYLSLAATVKGYAQLWSEHVGRNGVPATIALLQDDSADRQLKVGAIQSLADMAPSPFAYTFSREPNLEEDQRVVATWQLLWERAKSKYPPVDPDRAQSLEKKIAELAAMSRGEMFKAIQSPSFSADDIPFFAQVVLGDYPRAQKVPAAEFLRLYITERVRTDVPDDASPQRLAEVTKNWLAHYEAARATYEPSLAYKLYAVVGDTQYAHMVWRLVTFQFGNSTRKSREPVWQLLWEGFKVSAPLMFLAQLVIYVVAVPLGITAGVTRGTWVDRLISLGLFVLYSIPPYVAGMLMLLYLCYGDYLKIFPMERLHSQGAERLAWGPYILDYLWHLVLPVTCLSLFSLANLAMYGRSAMLDVLNQDYMRTAKAKGLSRFQTIVKHGLRNGMIPIITLFASFLPALLGGSVLIEYVFNINGLGLMGFRALLDKDVPTLMALIYVDAIVVMFSMLLTDVLYVLVDPRITFGGQGRS